MSVGDLFAAFIEVWKEILSGIWEVLPKLITFILWVLAALIILPCVFVANHFYPKWAKWTDDI